MKLLRWGRPGREKPGLLDDQGKVRDLSAAVADLGGRTVSLRSLDQLRGLDADRLPVVEPERLGPCLGFVPNFHAIGLNYAKHADEAGMPRPEEPILFSKATSCLSGPDDPVIIPKGSQKTDWEVEFGVVIGEEAEHVSESEALSRVAGYCVVNDVSERHFQTERGGQWIKGKSAPSFGPVGPWLVTADEIPDPQALSLSLRLNGETMQNSTTADMIFSVAEIISYMSRFMRLAPGDVIATGTPEGVGMGLSPQRFLKPGDEMELTVQGLGTQRQQVVAFPG
ncbi:MAG: fumarylacetoacetate hydrolase family protein [Pseudomonadota bacterium]